MKPISFDAERRKRELLEALKRAIECARDRAYLDNEGRSGYARERKKK